MPRFPVPAAVFAVVSTVSLLVLAHPGNPPVQAVLARPQASDSTVHSGASALSLEITIPDGNSIAAQTVSAASLPTPVRVAPRRLALASAPHFSITSVGTAATTVDSITDPTSSLTVPAPVLAPAVALPSTGQDPLSTTSSPPLPTDPSPSPDPTPTQPPMPPSTSTGWDSLTSDLAQMAQATGGHVAISLVQLGPGGQSWSYNGDDQMVAASTYKLPLLMAEAQGISSGSISPDDQVCFQSADWEDGYFQDYVDGACYARDDLANRIGINSDNTAARMLVRDLGGTDALNAAASSYGASNSAFLDPNTTTANDLAAIWGAEYSGNFGGSAAQQWLYPKLTQTRYEDGVPAGVPTGVTVVHKIGEFDSAVNDAALVENGSSPYVLVVLTDSTGQGFAPMATISARVWQYEATFNASQ